MRVRLSHPVPGFAASEVAPPPFPALLSIVLFSRPSGEEEELHLASVDQIA